MLSRGNNHQCAMVVDEHLHMKKEEVCGTIKSIAGDPDSGWVYHDKATSVRFHRFIEEGER